MTTEIGKLINTQVPARPTVPPADPPPPGGGHELQVFPEAIKKLAPDARRTEGDVRAATHKMVPESEQAARGLGPEWSTSAKITELTTSWEAALNKLAAQIGEVGPKLSATADNHLLAEARSRQAVQAVTRTITAMTGD
ncbi:hypothetical protein [Actinomadura napierensis]|uniref:Uncharacterized protein n=1 Tax=Actinomadura napierensis TaxID=267854 RepID=A0ABN3A4V1_9ACTN